MRAAAMIRTRTFRSVWILLMLSLVALAEPQEPLAVDPDREVARARIAEHLRNVDNAPPGGFAPVRVSDYGNIAVIEAGLKSGTLLPVNKFDLGGKSVLFKRQADGSYTVQTASSTITAGGGNTVTVGPAESRPVALPFVFPFYRSTYKSVFLHAGGNLTLGNPAKVPFGLSEHDLFHVAPRIAPLTSGNFAPVEVTIDAGSSQAVFTWRISAGASALRAQAVLSRSGDITFKYDSFPADKIAIAGITPGPSSKLPPQSIDFTRGITTPARGAVVEDFTSGGVDQVAVTKAFLANHSDTFDMLALFFSIRHPGRPSLPGTGVDVIYQNNIRGIGRARYNFARILGTSGRLKAVASMFDFESYPSDPRKSFPGYSPELGRTPLELVSHEIAHYWLASTRIVENGAVSTKLLSDGCCHWSFTFDADGSFMNGNNIQDNGNGTFTTTEALSRFSLLDQYLMGLIPASDVGPMFYVSSSTALPSDDARKNVTFSGARVNVTMDQILAAEGPRVPAYGASQHSFRIAFILIVDEGRKPAQKELQKLEKLRAAWPAYFGAAASNRITATSTLGDPPH